jgi:hypothetical protein
MSMAEEKAPIVSEEDAYCVAYVEGLSAGQPELLVNIEGVDIVISMRDPKAYRPLATLVSIGSFKEVPYQYRKCNIAFVDEPGDRRRFLAIPAGAVVHLRSTCTDGTVREQDITVGDSRGEIDVVW